MNSEKMTQYSHSKLQHIEFSRAVHDKSIFCWYFLNNYFEQFSLDEEPSVWLMKAVWEVSLSFITTRPGRDHRVASF